VRGCCLSGWVRPDLPNKSENGDEGVALLAGNMQSSWNIKWGLDFERRE